jgi:hypothetical protein
MGNCPARRVCGVFDGHEPVAAYWDTGATPTGRFATLVSGPLA